MDKDHNRVWLLLWGSESVIQAALIVVKGDRANRFKKSQR